MFTNFYFSFIYFFSLISFGISLILLILSYLIVYQNLDSEKISAYECGFQPFEDSRQKFDIHFYLVGILFIIFDLEIVFIFPWSLNINILNTFGFFSGLYFLIILTIGFIYEWVNNALDWS